MSAHPIEHLYWRTAALTGARLIALGVGAGYFDVFTDLIFDV